MKEFSEEAVIAAMRGVLPAELPRPIDDDELLNVVDIIWDYYDDNELLDIDSDDELDVTQLKSHVRKTLAKDKLSPVSPDLVDILVDAELAYEASLDEL